MDDFAVVQLLAPNFRQSVLIQLQRTPNPLAFDELTCVVPHVVANVGSASIRILDRFLERMGQKLRFILAGLLFIRHRVRGGDAGDHHQQQYETWPSHGRLT